MKTFRSVAIVRHPPRAVAGVVRDRLEELAGFLDDIEAVACVERTALPDGSVRQVNSWAAAPKISPAIAERIGRLSWFDDAVWASDGLTCGFTIRAPFAPNLACAGRVTYEPAMGGRGARISFEGEFDLAGGESAMDRMLLGAVELAAATLIPKNLKRTLEAAGQLLEAEALADQAAVMETEARVG
jgi:hypothetical protein